MAVQLRMTAPTSTIRIVSAVFALLLSMVFFNSVRGHYAIFRLLTAQSTIDVCLNGRGGGSCLDVKTAISTSWGYWAFVGYWLCEVALTLLIGLFTIGLAVVAVGVLDQRVMYTLDEAGVSALSLWRAKFLDWNDIESIHIEERKKGKETLEIVRCIRKSAPRGEEQFESGTVAAGRRRARAHISIVTSACGTTAADLIETMRRFKPELKIGAVP